jgi:hypothetical protein
VLVAGRASSRLVGREAFQACYWNRAIASKQLAVKNRLNRRFFAFATGVA